MNALDPSKVVVRPDIYPISMNIISVSETIEESMSWKVCDE